MGLHSKGAPRFVLHHKKEDTPLKVDEDDSELQEDNPIAQPTMPEDMEESRREDEFFDTSFVINSENYIPIYEPKCQSLKYEFKPKTLVQFPVILPFHMAIPDFTHVYYDDKGHDHSQIVGFHFSSVATPELMLTGRFSEEQPLAFPRYRTRIEMVYLTDQLIELADVPEGQSLTEGDRDDTGDKLSVIFDTCVRYLNGFMQAYIVTTKDRTVHRVSREQLQPMMPWRMVNLPKWDEAKTGILFLHMDVPYEKEPLSDTEMRNVMRHTWLLKEDLNPLIFSDELGVNSRRYYHMGFYQEAVIYAQLSVETFLRRLYEQLLIEGEGKIQAEAEATREEPFFTIVKNGLQARIGGTWDVTVTKKPVGTWYKDTYLLRNKVLHDGYFPTIEEAWYAIDAGIELRQYVARLLHSKKKKYPNTACYLIVRPSK